MPKAQRKPEEIEAIRQAILDHATDLIAEAGYKGFSMRKLGSRLGIAAKTIYNYFHGKDEIYLAVLTRGFETLHGQCAAAAAAHHDPIDKIAAMCRCFVDFGIDQANLYNLMFTWHVPKFRDYLGTDLEPAAQQELETALTVSGLFMNAIRACANGEKPMCEKSVRFLMIRVWCQAHGYIASINNNLLDYMYEAPLSLKDRLIEDIVENIRANSSDTERSRIETAPGP